jgi:hypothetical protein
MGKGAKHMGRRKSSDQEMYKEKDYGHGHMAMHDHHAKKFHEAAEHEEGRCCDNDGHFSGTGKHMKMEY